MSVPEFSRPVDIRGITAQLVRIEADEAERKALARRFEIVAIERLEAVVALEADGAEVDATGMLEADIVQCCAVSGDELPITIRTGWAVIPRMSTGRENSGALIVRSVRPAARPPRSRRACRPAPANAWLAAPARRPR